MTEMSKEDKEMMLRMQLDNIVSLTGGQISRSIMVDSKGNLTKRISITYKEDE